MSPRLNILVVEDDKLTRIGLSKKLQKHGDVILSDSISDALIQNKKIKFDLAIIDLDLRHELEGLGAVEAFSKTGVYCVVLSGREDEEALEKSYLKGAKDYLKKPFTLESISYLFERFSWDQRPQGLAEALGVGLISERDINSLEAMAVNIRTQKGPILITGESGTGKGHYARKIHQEIFGDNIPFIDFSCAEISEGTLKSELFGHRKGAFTGAVDDKVGLLERANGGTLFLDEVGLMPGEMQRALLKAIDEKCFFRVGESVKRKIDFMLISATCDDLHSMIAKGSFREDLFFRISSHHLKLAPLREKKEIIRPLVEDVLNKSPRRLKLSDDAYLALEESTWPGNIRELRQCVNRLISFPKGHLTGEDLRHLLKEQRPSFQESYVSTALKIGLSDCMRKIEENIIRSVLERNNNQVRPTLRDLQISASRFYKYINKGSLDE